MHFEQQLGGFFLVALGTHWEFFGNVLGTLWELFRNARNLFEYIFYILYIIEFFITLHHIDTMYYTLHHTNIMYYTTLYLNMFGKVGPPFPTDSSHFVEILI
jgi:hypothetical protein